MTLDPNNNLIASRRSAPMKRGALGKGLGALIPGKVQSKRNYFECPLSRIKPTPNQPRRTFDDATLKELAESIARSGIIQPLVVRQDGADYRLIAGERRFRASTLLGLATVPVVIKDVDPDEAFELALVENIQREDLNPIEEAEAYQRLMALRDWTQETASENLGKSRSSIANTLRLLKLTQSVQARIIRGELTSGAARAILAMPTDEDQETAAAAAVDQGLTVRQLEAIARRVKAGETLEDALRHELEPEPQAELDFSAPAATAKPPAAKPPATPKPADITDKTALALELSALLGASVGVFEDDNGGAIEIQFPNDTELARIVARLRQLA